MFVKTVNIKETAMAGDLDLDALDSLDIVEPEYTPKTESEAEAEDGGCEGGACKI